MGSFRESFAELYAPVRADIFTYCRALNHEPTPQQAHIYKMVMDGVYGRASNRISVKSGQGAGKTMAMGVTASWLAIRNTGAMLPITAPTLRQCKTWLVELGRTIEAADPWVRRLFTFQKTKLVVCGKDDWGISLVTASTPQTAQGLHEKNMSILVDEASGVSSELLEQWNGTFTNRGVPGNYPIFGMWGNPNTRATFFFRSFNDLREFFQTYTINTEECPIVSAEGPAFIAAAYGKDSDVYRVRVLGEFPHMDPTNIMSSEDLDACARTSKLIYIRVPRIWNGRNAPARQFGIDFARFGGDESTIYRRSGDAIVEWMPYSHVDPARVAEAAFLMQTRAGWKNDECIYVPDASGMGQGVMHKFHDAHKRVMEFHNGSASADPSYENRITQAWFNMAAKVRAKQCHIPNDNRLIQQLSTRRYFVTKKGKIVVEPKEDYVKRGFNSPDRADGIVTAFFDGVEAKTQIAQRTPGGASGGKRIGAGGLFGRASA